MGVKNMNTPMDIAVAARKVGCRCKLRRERMKNKKKGIMDLRKLMSHNVAKGKNKDDMEQYLAIKIYIKNKEVELVYDREEWTDSMIAELMKSIMSVYEERE